MSALRALDMTAGTAPTGSDRLLLEAVRRAVRQPARRMALVLHLSRLAAPAPRPHHRRIARAILDDTAQLHEGQVFAVGNGDMVLLCRESEEAPMAERRSRPGQPPANGLALRNPAALPATLAQLMRIDAPDARQLTTVWRLQHEPDAAIAYAVARATESTGSASFDTAPPRIGVPTGRVDGIGALVEATALTDLMHRRTGVLVAAPGTRQVDGGPVLRPLYREVALSMAELEARIAATGQAGADPYLFRHLAERIDTRLLAALQAAVGGGGPLDPAAAGQPAPRMHVHLTLNGILSDSFAATVEQCRRVGAPLGVEVSLVDACGDAVAFEQARHRLAEFGVALVLGDVSHLAVQLARPWALQPDLMKLDWSPRLATLAADERMHLAAAFDEIGVHRLVLHRADTEAALRWGLGQGIRRFQGQHVEAMLAASRLTSCPGAPRCSLRQCVERAAATGATGRSGCGTPALLDAAAPPGGP